MARVLAPLLAMNRGEVSKLALARVDLAKLQLAAECQLNWLPRVMGTMQLRPGLNYVGEVAGDNPAVLIDFIYAKSDCALLELTANTMRVRINDVLLSRVAVSTVVLDPNMSGTGSHWDTGDTTAGCTTTVTGGVATFAASARGGISRIKQTLTIAGGDQNKEHALRVVVTNGPVTIRVGSSDGLQDYMTSTAIDTGTHSLVFTPTGGSAFLQIESTDTWAKTLTSVSIEAAGVVSLPTPWGQSTLSSLRWDQSEDVVYVAQYGGQQYKIERRGVRPGARGWSVVLYRSNTGPFLNLPTTQNCLLTSSVYEGNGSLVSSRPFFQPGHVGAMFQVFSPGQNNGNTLGAYGVFTDPIRISGHGAPRKCTWTATGTWAGMLTLQQSIIGPSSGFSALVTETANGSYLYDDTSSGTADVPVWLRVGFVNAADYTSGAPTITWSGAGSQQGGQYGLCRVTGYVSPTQVTMEVLSYGAQNGGGAFSTGVASSIWAESAWSNLQGWPTTVCFVEGRLGWFSALNFPMALSQSNNFTGFASADMYGNPIGDSGVILANFGSGPADRINFSMALERLLLGREESIASVRSSSFDTPLTPTDFSVKDCSEQGAAALPAVKIGKSGIYVQAHGKKAYALEYVPQTNDYGSRDLNRLNPDIGSPGFSDLAFSKQPDGTLWLPRADGQVACLLYDPNDEVEAWWRLQTLGVIENVRRLPNYDNSGPDDYVYFVVKRVVNGVTRRFIEKLSQRANCAGGLLNEQLDSAYVYSGSPVSSITIPWLPNTTVSVWADGAFIGTGTTDGSGILSALPDAQSHANIVAGLAGSTFSWSNTTPANVITGLDAWNGLPGEFFADQQPSSRLIRIGTLTPSGGSVTLPNGIEASSVVGFFGYQAPFMSAKLAYGARSGTAVTLKKRIDHLGLVLFDAHAQGISYGQQFDQLDELPLSEAGADVDPDSIWSEYDDQMIELGGEWDTDARLCLLAQAPFPAKVGGCVIAMSTNEK